MKYIKFLTLLALSAAVSIGLNACADKASTSTTTTTPASTTTTTSK